jgi:hypothetical protein
MPSYFRALGASREVSQVSRGRQGRSIIKSGSDHLSNDQIIDAYDTRLIPQDPSIIPALYVPL